MKKVTIYGERCSGTNYLEELLLHNFDVQLVWDYGWKHFFGFNNLTHSEEVLFIGIVRNLEDWLNSLYREKHHLPANLTVNIDTYLTGEIYSLKYDKKTEIMEDRNMETNERYKNIFELRHVKNKFLIEKMPNLVKHYCLITHDALIHDFTTTMHQLKDCGLKVKSNIEFPINMNYYKKNKNIAFKKKDNQISREKIKEKISDPTFLCYEPILFPNMPPWTTD